MQKWIIELERVVDAYEAAVDLVEALEAVELQSETITTPEGSKAPGVTKIIEWLKRERNT